MAIENRLETGRIFRLQKEEVYIKHSKKKFEISKLPITMMVKYTHIHELIMISFYCRVMGKKQTCKEVSKCIIMFCGQLNKASA